MKKRKSKNNRQRMRMSNQMVKKFLLERKFDHIWFKHHTKRSDVVYTQRGTYWASDLWNLFDGICFSPRGDIVFLQMKTNQWVNKEKLKGFAKRHKVIVLSFNVTDKLKECKNKFKVFFRSYGKIFWNKNKYPDVNMSLLQTRKKILETIKDKKFNDCFESLKHLNNLLPNKYRVVVSNIKYEKMIKIKTFFICNECKKEIKVQEIIVKDKIWVCPKCQNENKLSDTTIVEEKNNKPIYYGIVPKPPMKINGLWLNEKIWDRKCTQWCRNFLTEIEQKVNEYRNDYREIKDDGKTWE